MDIEELVMHVVHGWWGEEHMRDYVWAGLSACRATLHACGHQVESEEYQTLTFLLDLYHELGRGN